MVVAKDVVQHVQVLVAMVVKAVVLLVQALAAEVARVHVPMLIAKCVIKDAHFVRPPFKETL